MTPAPTPGPPPFLDGIDTVVVWPIVVSGTDEDTGRVSWLPLLIAEHSQTLVEFSGGQPQPVDLILAAYTRRGMAPVASPLYDEPPTCPDWRVTLPAAGDNGRIVHTDGLVMCDDLSGVRFPEQFAVAAAVNGGHCALLVTSGVGVVRFKRDRAQGGPDGLMHALTAAAAAGRLVGCLAAVTARAADRPAEPTRRPAGMRPRRARGNNGKGRR